MQKASKNLITGLIIFSFIFAFSASATEIPGSAREPSPRQTTRPTRMDPEGIVDHVLCSMGLGCGSSTIATTTTTQTRTIQNGSALTGSVASSGGLFGFGRSRSTRGLIYGATILKDYSGNEITLVRVQRLDSVAGELKTNEEVYEVIRGKKHLIPNLDIFYEYGFRPEWVQFISQEQLDKYPRIKLIQVQGDKKKTVYYLTDGGLRRRVLNEDIIKSYGDRTQDIIVISRKEFTYYPDNKFIHLETPTKISADIYLIDGDNKRYLTLLAVSRMNIERAQIAPVNETEFNSYEIGKSVEY